MNKVMSCKGMLSFRENLLSKAAQSERVRAKNVEKKGKRRLVMKF
jgi:hypothetical protein